MFKEDLILLNMNERGNYLKEKDRKDTELVKYELGGKIMKLFTALRAKTCSCLTDNNDEVKKEKGTKTSQRKGKLNMEDYK